MKGKQKSKKIVPRDLIKLILQNDLNIKAKTTPYLRADLCSICPSKPDYEIYYRNDTIFQINKSDIVEKQLSSNDRLMLRKMKLDHKNTPLNIKLILPENIPNQIRKYVLQRAAEYRISPISMLAYSLNEWEVITKPCYSACGSKQLIQEEMRFNFDNIQYKTIDLVCLNQKELYFPFYNESLSHSSGEFSRLILTLNVEVAFPGCFNNQICIHQPSISLFVNTTIFDVRKQKYTTDDKLKPSSNIEKNRNDTVKSIKLKKFKKLQKNESPIIYLEEESTLSANPGLKRITFKDYPKISVNRDENTDTTKSVTITQSSTISSSNIFTNKSTESFYFDENDDIDVILAIHYTEFKIFSSLMEMERTWSGNSKYIPEYEHHGLNVTVYDGSYAALDGVVDLRLLKDIKFSVIVQRNRARESFIALSHMFSLGKLLRNQKESVESLSIIVPTNFIPTQYDWSYSESFKSFLIFSEDSYDVKLMMDYVGYVHHDSQNWVSSLIKDI